MKRDIRDFLNDIIAYSEKAQEVLDRGVKQIDQFSDEGMILILCLQIIGEAVKQIPEEIRANYPDIPWKRVAGLRDKLIHDYWGTDMPIVMFVVRENLPKLKSTVKQILQDIEN
ncbi:MAG TPA: DUF86 domain-containing protein [Saprospiraceae bacterium]|nr:DUF86 domain-containing protein [Saprospiraceae bacterium]HNM26387.1 DUF86 domain-containing protein [Saprospiraceae bacterium]